MRRPEQRGHRLIDRIRDGGGQAEIAADTGNIIAMFSTDRLYFLTQRGVTSAQLADQIDPGRENISIPQFVQRLEFAYGAETSFVQRTIGIAISLLKPGYLPPGIDLKVAFGHCLSAAENMASVADTLDELRKSESETREALNLGEGGRDALPRTPNLKGRTEQAISHFRSVQLAAIKLGDIFHPRNPPNQPFRESLVRAIGRNSEAEDDLAAKVDTVLAVLDRVGNYRNAMIHQDIQKSLICRDYELQSDGTLLAPTIEIAHPSTPLTRRDTVQFLDVTLEEVSFAFEFLFAALCDRNARAEIGLSHFVLHDPEEVERSGGQYRWHSEWKEGFPRVGNPEDRPGEP